MQSLAGTMWTLVEASETDENGNQLPAPLGPHPMGFLIFEQGRAMVSVCDDFSDSERAGRPKVFFGYSGKYQFDGERLSMVPDRATAPEYLVEQVRRARFDSPRRMTIMPVSELLGRSRGLTFVWERVK
jgi:Lipocalin-like domain